MTSRIFICLWFAGLFAGGGATLTRAQNSVIEQAKKEVTDLSSEQYLGRGYDNQGHVKAATYIKNRFEEIGLEPLAGNWYQKFKITVNNINQAELIINGDTLTPGIDFIPYATSGSGKNNLESNIQYAEQGLFIPDIGVNQLPIYSARNAILVMDHQFPDSLSEHRANNPTFYTKSYRIQVAKALKAQALIFLSGQLTHEVPFYRNQLPVFEVKEQEWPLSLNTISYTIETSYDTTVTQNVMGILEGRSKPDSVIMLSAHYDHFGSIAPDTYYPGANDNASGIAMLFSLARYFSSNPLDYTLLFVAFGAEELGLKGSDYFVEHPPIRLNQLKFVMNFDMVASGAGGMVAVGGKNYNSYYRKLQQINDSLALGPIKARENAPNSDHFRFLEQMIPGFYIYTNNGKQPYHHVNDTAGSLDWNEFRDVYDISRAFLEQL